MGIKPTSEPWVATSLSQKKPGRGGAPSASAFRWLLFGHMGDVVAAAAEPPGLTPVPRALDHPQDMIEFARSLAFGHTNDAEKARYVSFGFASLRVLSVQSIPCWLGRGQAPYSLGSAYLFLPVSFGLG